MRGARPVLAALVLAACTSGPEIPPADELFQGLDQESPGTHSGGPGVVVNEHGPARFVAELYSAIDVERAMATTAYLDARMRVPGTPGFDECIDLIAGELRRAGFGSSEHLELTEVVAPLDVPGWVGERGRVAMRTPDGAERDLHAFSQPSERDRNLIPTHAPAARVEGDAFFSLEDLRPGGVLVTETRVRPDLILRARNGGAVAIVSASLGTYNVDPTGAQRHLDAIQARAIEPGGDMPVAQISLRSFQALRAAHDRQGAVTVLLEAEVSHGSTQARTLVATVVGRELPRETVALVAHVQDPGACDNASGAAGMLEVALVLGAAVASGERPPPARSMTFIWGAEVIGSEAWLEHTRRDPVASVSAVMVGESRAETGAVPLLERHPDPGAVRELPPDEHTLWGRRDVDEAWLVPNGLAVIARCAMVDVSVRAGGWQTSENPYEGGTDHESFIRAGVPSVLFWHFTDFTFHTSLDRMDMVDGEEIRRTSVAAAATALSVADPAPADLDRYLRSNSAEITLRVEAARDAGDEELAQRWTGWGTGVRHWFRALCLGSPDPSGGGEGGN